MPLLRVLAQRRGMQAPPLQLSENTIEGAGTLSSCNSAPAHPRAPHLRGLPVVIQVPGRRVKGLLPLVGVRCRRRCRLRCHCCRRCCCCCRGRGLAGRGRGAAALAHVRCTALLVPIRIPILLILLLIGSPSLRLRLGYGTAIAARAPMSRPLTHRGSAGGPSAPRCPPVHCAPCARQSGWAAPAAADSSAAWHQHPPRAAAPSAACCSCVACAERVPRDGEQGTTLPDPALSHSPSEISLQKMQPRRNSLTRRAPRP